MKKILTLLVLAGGLGFGAVQAEPPVIAAKYYELWNTLDTGLAAVAPGNQQAHRYVQVLEVKGDWVRARLFPSDETAMILYGLDEVKKDSELGKKFLKALGRTREDLLKEAAEKPVSPADARELWINLSKVAAIGELEPQFEAKLKEADARAVKKAAAPAPASTPSPTKE